MQQILRLITLVGVALTASAEITGNWQFAVVTPSGNDNCTFELRAANDAIEGYYSGLLGVRKPVSGTFSANKISFKFKAEWPDSTEVEVQVSGELNDEAGSGTVVAVNKAEGTWTARRVNENSKPESESQSPEASVRPDASALGKLAGEWKLNPESAQAAEAAIEQLTQQMSVFARGVAKSRLAKTNTPPDRVRMQRQGELFIIELNGAPAQSLPISGAPLQQGERTLRLELESGGDGAIRQIGETPEGKRINAFLIGANQDAMSMQVTMTSPRLPAPLRYTLEFTRIQPPSTISVQQR